MTNSTALSSSMNKRQSSMSTMMLLLMTATFLVVLPGTPALNLVAANTIVVTTATTNGDLFSGDYSDPNHPNCLRHIQVVSHSDAVITGTDGNVGPSCPPGGEGKSWRLKGSIVDDGTKIIVDFSPKGGPKKLQGVSTIEGIKWEDGNLWGRIQTSNNFFRRL